VVSSFPSRARRAAALATLLVFLVGMAAAVVPAPASADSGGSASQTRVMRDNRVTPQQMAAWFRSRSPGGYAAQTSIDELTRLYVTEGRDEGVAGDLAFIQAILETSWFRYPDHGQVRAAFNNYAGMGACDGGTCTVARFRSPRIGVRAQIQHLRAYADPSVTATNLAHPLESPRFHLVHPKGRSPLWEDFGGGNWASDPDYSGKILRLYRELIAFADPTGAFQASVQFGDVHPSTLHGADILSIAAAGLTNGCGNGRMYCPDERVRRAEMASFLVRASDIPPSTRSRFADVARTNVHHGSINALADAGFTGGCDAAGNYCPARHITRAEMASFLQRVGGLPARGTTRFADVSARSTHGASISAIADAGWAHGCGDGTNFCPDRAVTRAEMAAFLRRAFLGGS
jgi:hypothetical protein